MRQVHLYLPTEYKQDVICERWKHVLKKIDREFCEVRVYIAGSDFQYADAEYDLPYCIETLPGEKPKKRSFETMYTCLLYTSPSPRDRTRSRMPSSA